jgi:hypothetical protein
MNGFVNHDADVPKGLLTTSFLPPILALVLGFCVLAVSAPAAETSEPGISYRNEKVEREPWSIHVIQIDRSRKDLGFFAPHARGRVLGVSLLAEQARSIPAEIGKPVAGVNGDFYLRDVPTFAGDPRGLQIMNGELISAPDTVCVWFDAEGNPHLDEVKANFAVTWTDGSKAAFRLNEQRKANNMVLYTPTYGASTRVSGGRNLILESSGDGPWLPLQADQTYHARVREVRTNANAQIPTNAMVLSIGPQLLASMPEIEAGAIVQISTATTPDLKGVKVAIGGGPTLLKDGKAFPKSAPPGVSQAWSERSKYERHPRSAFGWSPTHFYLIVVDGRQPGLSIGMKLGELAEYFQKLGCTDAINLDGGKSSQLWLAGEIKNSPCQGEDTVANSLFVVRKPSSR